MTANPLRVFPPTATLPDPLLVDEPEARRLLGGLCAKTMYNLRRSGELAWIKIGSRVMYDVADLRAFIERQKGASRD